MLTYQIKTVFDKGFCDISGVFSTPLVFFFLFFVLFLVMTYILTGLLEFNVHMVNTERTVIIYPCTLILLMLFLQMYEWVISTSLKAGIRTTKMFT